MIEELLNEIRWASEALLKNGMLQSKRGNNAAGVRARKASLELEQLNKAFREASHEAAKVKKESKKNNQLKS